MIFTDILLFLSSVRDWTRPSLIAEKTRSPFRDGPKWLKSGIFRQTDEAKLRLSCIFSIVYTMHECALKRRRRGGKKRGALPSDKIAFSTGETRAISLFRYKNQLIVLNALQNRLPESRTPLIRTPNAENMWEMYEPISTQWITIKSHSVRARVRQFSQWETPKERGVFAAFLRAEESRGSKFIKIATCRWHALEHFTVKLPLSVALVKSKIQLSKQHFILSANGGTCHARLLTGVNRSIIMPLTSKVDFFLAQQNETDKRRIVCASLKADLTSYRFASEVSSSAVAQSKVKFLLSPAKSADFTGREFMQAA